LTAQAVAARSPPESNEAIGPQIQQRCAYINIPTAKTSTITSAIHVSSLLFSANQSAIDECATPLSLLQNAGGVCKGRNAFLDTADIEMSF
jgi:hypothetical protein